VVGLHSPATSQNIPQTTLPGNPILNKLDMNFFNNIVLLLALQSGISEASAAQSEKVSHSRDAMPDPVPQRGSMGDTAPLPMVRFDTFKLPGGIKPDAADMPHASSPQLASAMARAGHTRVAIEAHNHQLPEHTMARPGNTEMSMKVKASGAVSNLATKIKESAGTEALVLTHHELAEENERLHKTIADLEAQLRVVKAEVSTLKQEIAEVRAGQQKAKVGEIWSLYKTNWNCGAPHHGPSGHTLASCKSHCSGSPYMGFWTKGADTCRCYDTCNGSPTDVAGGIENEVYEKSAVEDEGTVTTHSWTLGNSGESCDTVCSSAGTSCDSSGFTDAKDCAWIQSTAGAPTNGCGDIGDGPGPVIGTGSSPAAYTGNYAQSTCSATATGYRRLCPCSLPPTPHPTPSPAPTRSRR